MKELVSTTRLSKPDLEPVDIIPEWENHDGVILAWPWDQREWAVPISDVQRTIVEIVQKVREPVFLLVKPEIAQLATPELSTSGTIWEVSYGDIWVRDTCPWIGRSNERFVGTHGTFNGWGNKFELEGDKQLSGWVSRQLDLSLRKSVWVWEGGAFESDGKTILTTTDCLLNPNRNPGWTEKELEKSIRDIFVVDDVVIFDGALMNDHTDGHIDTLVRYVEPGCVALMEPKSGDPNFATLMGLFAEAKKAGLRITSIPSPGAVLDSGGELLPASYLNFYIANEVVLVPTYGVQQDDSALLALEKCFPSRDIVPVDCRGIVTGGGAIHCITQQIPKGVL